MEASCLGPYSDQIVGAVLARVQSLSPALSENVWLFWIVTELLVCVKTHLVRPHSKHVCLRGVPGRGMIIFSLPCGCVNGRRWWYGRLFLSDGSQACMLPQDSKQRDARVSLQMSLLPQSQPALTCEDYYFPITILYLPVLSCQWQAVVTLETLATALSLVGTFSRYYSAVWAALCGLLGSEQHQEHRRLRGEFFNCRRFGMSLCTKLMCMTFWELRDRSQSAE